MVYFTYTYHKNLAIHVGTYRPSVWIKVQVCQVSWTYLEDHPI